MRFKYLKSFSDGLMNIHETMENRMKVYQECHLFPKDSLYDKK